MKIFVKVKAGAAENNIKQLDATHYEVTTTELPVRGRANTAVIKQLAGFLKLPPSLLVITRGQTSKQKTITINTSKLLL